LEEAARKLIEYVKREVIRQPDLELNEDTPLVSSGLVDSFALVDVLMEMEDITNTKIPASKVRPNDMDTVRLMLGVAERLGKPRG
jgi:acyl carrier protein